MKDLYGKKQWLNMLQHPAAANTHERTLIEAIKTARGPEQLTRICMAYPNLAAAYTDYLTHTMIGGKHYGPAH